MLSRGYLIYGVLVLAGFLLTCDLGWEWFDARRFRPPGAGGSGPSGGFWYSHYSVWSDRSGNGDLHGGK
jgi:hypothetical protein